VPTGALAVGATTALGTASGALASADRWPRPRPLFGRWCVPPPPAGPGVCHTCHGPAGAGYGRCWSCAVVTRQLGPGTTAPPVVPISIFAPGSNLHRVLVTYKSGPDAGERARCGAGLAELIATWLSLHGHCLARVAGGGWDVIDVVPSTRRADPVHPLAAALATLPALAGRVAPLLGRGPAPVGHLQPAADAFRTCSTAPPSGARVLLLDDVYTTGAHALSAAAALEAAGARVVAIVPVGRLVHAESWPGSEWWARFCGPVDAPSTIGVRRCALEAGAYRRHVTVGPSYAASPRRTGGPVRARPGSPTPPRREGPR
jgi:hypothetical protein